MFNNLCVKFYKGRAIAKHLAPEENEFQDCFPDEEIAVPKAGAACQRTKTKDKLEKANKPTESHERKVGLLSTIKQTEESNQQGSL